VYERQTLARRCLIVAAGPRAAAETFAREQGISATIVTRDELGLGRRLRAAVRSFGAEVIVVHTPDWRRQLNPQLYELALALAPAQERYVADDSAGIVRPVGRPEALARIVLIPGAVIVAAASTALEATRILNLKPNPVRSPRQRVSTERALLAVWLGSPGTAVGGSVTHVSGVLGGFRRSGYRIGLVTLMRPPSQLQRVIDDLEVAPPLPAYARLTSDVEAILVNDAVRRSALELARRLRPALVYQRHRAFLVAGLQVARAHDARFVLEWNSSEVWTRENWSNVLRIERVLDPLIKAMERYVLVNGDLTVAVSGVAAKAAITAGADPGKVIVVPNAVDVDEVDAAIDRSVPSLLTEGGRIGWIGSFGPWHGAEVLIRALAQLAPDIELVMVGEGNLRSSLQSLAADLGVAGRIEWTGSLPHEEALRRLSQCDVLASPHTPFPDQEFFGSPTKIFEYMAIGRPIVASALGQLAEVLEDGRTAQLVTPGDARALAKGISTVLSLPDRGEALGRAAREAALLHHTWDHRARNIVEGLGEREAKAV
jgi:glycosyltransferase involved in cell wall biosynthesis